jgi:hypothetical protein
MVKELRLKTSNSAKKGIIVIDAGIATEANLTMLKEKRYDYLYVTRSRMKNYLLEANNNEVTVLDNEKHKISLQKVRSSKDDDYYLKRSRDSKRKKECSMNDHFREGFETGLKKDCSIIIQKGGIKKEDKVYERIGGLKQKYPSIQRYFNIRCEVERQTKERNKNKSCQHKEQANEKRIVTSIQWNINEDSEINSHSGIYFIRTLLNGMKQSFGSHIIPFEK